MGAKTSHSKPNGLTPCGKPKYRSKFEEKLHASAPKATYETTCFAYARPQRYTVDFTLPNGVCIEAKGYFQSSDRTKLLLVREQNPGTDIRLIFQKDNRLSKKSKTTYSQWAEKHGFQYHVGNRIPKAWLKEKPK
jgi:hypothetical protein